MESEVNLMLPKVNTRKQYKQRASKTEDLQPGSSSVTENFGLFKLPMLPGMSRKTTKKSKEGIKDYITKKRELQMIQFNLDIKEAEVNDLASSIENERKDLLQAERNLEMETKYFEEFKLETTRTANEASKTAVIAVKSKMEKVKEIERLDDQIEHIKEEKKKYEDSLKESQDLRVFFENLIPQHEGGFDPKELLAVYDEIRQEIWRLFASWTTKEETAHLISERIKGLKETYEESIRVLEDEVSEYTAQLTKAQQSEQEFMKGLARYHEYVSSTEYQNKTKARKILNEKIAEIYQAHSRSDESSNLETADCGEPGEACDGGALFQLAKLLNVLKELMKTVETLPKDKVLALRKLRKQQREDIQRRSRLLTPKTDGGCSRCEERNKQQTNSRLKNDDTSRHQKAVCNKKKLST